MLLSPLFDLAIELRACDLVKLRIVDAANGDRSLFDRAAMPEVRRTHWPHGAPTIVQRGEQASPPRRSGPLRVTRVGRSTARHETCRGSRWPRRRPPGIPQQTAHAHACPHARSAACGAGAYRISAEDDQAMMQMGACIRDGVMVHYNTNT